LRLRADEIASPDEVPVLIARVSKHLVAIVDGELHDTHDCSRDGTRYVYGYWRL
jgi:hypothetical protein